MQRRTLALIILLLLIPTISAQPADPGVIIDQDDTEPDTNQSVNESIESPPIGKEYTLNGLSVIVSPSGWLAYPGDNISYVFLVNSSKNTIIYPTNSTLPFNSSWSKLSFFLGSGEETTVFLNISITNPSITYYIELEARFGNLNIPLELRVIQRPVIQIDESLMINEDQTIEHDFSANNKKFKFYNRQKWELVNFTDDDGYWVSFTPTDEVKSIKADKNTFEANCSYYISKYEIISSRIIKNTITLDSKPKLNTISEKIKFPQGIKPVICEDGSIRFKVKGTLNKWVFKINAPIMCDSENTYGACHYEIIGNKLELIMDQNFLDTAIFPIFVDPTWEDTTTNDWDSGTKSASLGNTETETNTDNPAKAINCLELTDKYGYNNNYSDTDSDIWKYNTVNQGASADIDTTENDALYFNAPAGTRIVYQVGGISGDFDFRISCHRTTMPPKADQGNRLLDIGLYNSGSSDGVLIRYRDEGLGQGPVIYTDIVKDTVWEGNTQVAHPGSDFTVRIYRDGLDLYVQYDLSGGESWTELKSLASWSSDDMVSFSFYHGYSGSDATIIGYTYWWKILGGTLAGEPYRTSGNWTQNITMQPNYTIGNWTVNLTNGDPNHYINVSWWQDGLEIARCDNITSNITIIESTLTNGSWNNLTAGNFQYKLELNGNGTSSTTIQTSYGFENQLPRPSVDSDDLSSAFYADQFYYPTTLNGSGSTDDGSIVNYTWSFTYNATNQTLYGQTVNFSFEEGTYQITLTVTDNQGGINSTTYALTISPLDTPSKISLMMEYFANIMIILVIVLIILSIVKKASREFV